MGSRTSQSMWTNLVYWATLCLFSALVAITVGACSQFPGQSEEGPEHTLVEIYGFDESEAQGWADTSAQALPVASYLRKRYPSTFGGAYVDHEQRIIAALVTADVEAVQEDLAREFPHLSSHLVVMKASSSFSDLEHAFESLLELRDSLAGSEQRFWPEVDIRSNSLIVVFEGISPETQERIRATTADVDVVLTPGESKAQGT